MTEAESTFFSTHSQQIGSVSVEASTAKSVGKHANNTASAPLHRLEAIRGGGLEQEVLLRLHERPQEHPRRPPNLVRAAHDVCENLNRGQARPAARSGGPRRLLRLARRVVVVIILLSTVIAILAAAVAVRGSAGRRGRRRRRREAPQGEQIVRERRLKLREDGFGVVGPAPERAAEEAVVGDDGARLRCS